MNLKYILQEFNIRGGANPIYIPTSSYSPNPSSTQIISNIYFIKKKNNKKDIELINKIGTEIDNNYVINDGNITNLNLSGKLFLIKNKDIRKTMEIVLNSTRKDILEKNMNIKKVIKSTNTYSIKVPLNNKILNNYYKCLLNPYLASLLLKPPMEQIVDTIKLPFINECMESNDVKIAIAVVNNNLEYLDKHYKGLSSPTNNPTNNPTNGPFLNNIYVKLNSTRYYLPEIAIFCNSFDIFKKYIDYNTNKNDHIKNAIKFNRIDFLKLLINDTNVNSRIDTQDRTALMIAAENGNAEIVRNLIYFGADIYLNDNRRYTALIYAAKNNKDAVVEILVNHASITTSPTSNPTVTLTSYLNHKNNEGYTALYQAIDLNLYDTANLLIKTDEKYPTDGKTVLMIAAEEGNKKHVSALIKYGANINLQDEYGYTALMIAVDNDYEEIVNILIDAGANIYAHDRYGSTALIIAANTGNIKIVESLINRASITTSPTSNPTSNLISYLDKKNNTGETALKIAVQNKKDDIVRLLIKSGAEYANVLLNAAKKGNNDNVLTLINAGADIYSKDEYGNTALIYAARKSIDIVKLLINRASITTSPTSNSISNPTLTLTSYLNHKNNAGYTALWFAIRNKKHNIAKLLIKSGAKYANILINAVKDHNEDDVSALIEAGADIYSQDDKGNTPLMIAVENNNEDMVKILVNHAYITTSPTSNPTLNPISNLISYLDKKNNDDKTALMIALEKKKNNNNVVKLLIKHIQDYTTDEYITDELKNLPVLVIAIFKEHVQIVKMLIDAGADINDKFQFYDDDEELTPLDAAINSLNSDIDNDDTQAIVKILITAGGNITIYPDGDGTTALMQATINKHEDIVKSLIQRAATITSPISNPTSTPIPYIDLQDSDGKTALMYAVLWAGDVIVNELIKAGADINLKDNEGKTAFMYARSDKIKALLSPPTASPK